MVAVIRRPHGNGGENMATRPKITLPRVAATVAVMLVAALAIGAGSPSAASIQPPRWALHGSYSPSIDPAKFVATIDNPYFPLQPGTAFHYKGMKGKTPQTDDMVVTHETKLVLGVKCTVVRDTVSERGKPAERTFDSYAQDNQGNVWYMGEESFELKNDHFVRASDSWESGVNGAKPGIIMPANPQPRDVYRQEYYPPGGALDQALVLARQRQRAVRDVQARARHGRVEPRRAAVRAEALRGGCWRGFGARDPGRP